MCFTKSRNASSTLMFSFALVSKNKAFELFANSWPSASETSRYSAKSHLLPRMIKGHFSSSLARKICSRKTSNSSKEDLEVMEYTHRKPSPFRMNLSPQSPLYSS
eukprot:Lithocolla_globosa_v1_NODE_6206_length_1122_cov_21.157451.p3 type:complete len:105 gc:universal NODE_6206_length_1122_cov_21.157451:522-836(+)